jgi:hypothetical protein
MLKLTALCLALTFVLGAVELPSKKFLNLAAIKTLVAAAEAEAAKRNVQVTLCIMDESGNVVPAEGRRAGLNTIQFAQRRRSMPRSMAGLRKGADALAGGNLQILAFPTDFPTRAGCRSRWTDARSVRWLPAARRRKWTRRSARRRSMLY